VGSIPDGVIGIFLHNPSGPWVDSASNRNEYQEYFLGCKGWTVPIVLKSGSMNLLERSGPVQACNGIAFTFLAFVSFKEDE
jgi:hypothetical protein